MVDEGTAFFFVKGLAEKQIVHYPCGRKAERAGQDAVDPDTGNRHAVLVTVLFRSAHVRKF